MYKSSVNYIMQLAEPFVTSSSYPVKYFTIPIASVNYGLRYTPVTLHSSLLMTDYLLASNFKLSDAAFNNLQLAIKEQFESDNEFIVVEGSRADLGAIDNSLAYYGKLEDTRSGDINVIEYKGKRLEMTESQIVDNFTTALRNLRRNRGQISFLGHFKRDRQHGALIHSSLSFLRDRVHGLELGLLSGFLRDFKKKTDVYHSVQALKDYIHITEISHMVGAGSREDVHGLVTTSVGELLRHSTQYMEYPSIKSFKRDYIDDLHVSHANIVASRTYVFDMLKEFYITGKRPIQKNGDVRWEHIIADRIIESDMAVQHSIIYMERNKVKGGHVSFGDNFLRNRLRETIISHAILQGKLKARQFPSHIHFSLQNWDRIISRDYNVRNFIASDRNITKDLVLPTVIDIVRGIEHSLTTHTIRHLKRDIQTATSVRYSQIPVKRDITEQLAGIYTTQNEFKPIQAVRDNVDKLVIDYALYKSKRDNVSDGKIIYGDIKQYERDIVADMSVIFSDIPTERIYTNKATTLNYSDNITANRDNTFDLFYKYQGKHFERDIKSDLFLLKEERADRSISKDMHHHRAVQSDRNLTKIALISELDTYERNLVKDLMLSHIGEYVRSNIHGMGGNKVPHEMLEGGTLPPTTLAAYLMEDELLGELVDDFASIVDTMFMGESIRPLGGIELAEKMLAVRERIEGFVQGGLLQGTADDRGGLLVFPDVIGLNEKGGILPEEDRAGQRIDNQGQINDQDYEGHLQETGGILGDSLDDEDVMAFGYILADAADFLSPEELASLPDNRGGNLGEGQSLGSLPENRGGIISDDLSLGTHPILNGGFLEKEGRIDLLGFHSILLDSHLHEDMIIATPMKKELQGVIHETLDGSIFNDRKFNLVEDLNLGITVRPLSSLLTDEQLFGNKERFGNITSHEFLAKFNAKEFIFPEIEYLVEKYDYKAELLDVVESVKEKLNFAQLSLLTASRPNRDGFMDDEILAVKEKLVDLHEVLSGYGPERYFHIEELNLAEKIDKAGFIEKHKLFGDSPEKSGFYGEILLGGRPGKSGFVENEITAEKEHEFYYSEGIFSQKYIYGTVETDSPVGWLIRPLHGTITDEPIFGGRVSEFSAVTVDEMSFGQRQNVFEAYTMDDITMGQRVDGFDGTFVVEDIQGGRIDWFGGVQLTEYILGNRPDGSFSIMDSDFLGEKINNTATINKDNLFAVKFHLGTIGNGLYAEKLRDSYFNTDFIVSEKYHDAFVEHLTVGKGSGKSSHLVNFILANETDKDVYVEKDFLVADLAGKDGYLVETEFYAKKAGLDSHILTVIEAIKETESVIDNVLLADRKQKISYIESDNLLGLKDNKGGYILDTVAATIEKDVLVHEGIEATLKVAEGLIEKENYLYQREYTGGYIEYSLIAESPIHEGLIIEREEIEAQKQYVETTLSDAEQYLSSPPERTAATPTETHEANLLEKYSVTTEQYLQAEKYMWVGILVNLLFADEEKGKSYVEYLNNAGVINQTHYELLNGLVGDLVEKTGIAYGQEIYADLDATKTELINDLHAQGLMYDYDDFQQVLNPGTDIEEWELDLGFALPERYDPYDPYNSYYPSIIDNYDHSALSLMQLEDWIQFGGTNWDRDIMKGTFRSERDNENNNGYYLNKQGMTDYKISADFIVDADAEDSDAVGLVFKYTDELNYYKFVITGSYNNSVGMNTTSMQLFKVTNGVVQPFGSAISPETYTKGEFHNIKISYVNKEILIWVDNRLQYEIIDY